MSAHSSFVSVDEARGIAAEHACDVTDRTIRNWARDHGIGKKFGRDWVIDRTLLIDHITKRIALAG